MNGKMGPMGDEVQHFVELLKTKLPYPVVLWDERLTTVQAERLLRESNLNRKKRSKVIDSMTAVILLQSYLDSLRLMR
jgi:putative Holliday junction resolvase